MRIYKPKSIAQVLFFQVAFTVLSALLITILIGLELRRAGAHQHQIDYLCVAVVSGTVWLLSVAVRAFTHNIVLYYDIHENIIDSGL